MDFITKEDVIYAFRKRNTKRRDLVFTYYRKWFKIPLTANVLAEKISEDLGIKIGPSIIYHIRSKHKPILVTDPTQPAISSITVTKEDSSLSAYIPDLDSLAKAKSSSLIQFYEP